MRYLAYSTTCAAPELPSQAGGWERAAVSERTCEREHRIAECLQRVLLHAAPKETLHGLSVETFQEAAMDEATVCGDSGDAFALAGDRVALVVADASGKGLAAAERVAEIRFALRAFLREHADPRRALACLNDFVCDAQSLGKRDDGAFATVTLVVLNGASGEMDCLCAGGEPPMILRADGTVEWAPICGAALGLLPSQGYAAAPLHLAPSDTVLLATDGITEAHCRGRRDPTASFLGLMGLAHLAVQTQDMTASLSEIGRAIFEGARAFAGGTFHDDASLLLGRRETRSEATRSEATRSEATRSEATRSEATGQRSEPRSHVRLPRTSEGE